MRYAKSLVRGLGLLGPLALVGACGEAPVEARRPVTGPSSAFWPDTAQGELGSSADEVTGRNPWLIGFGGAGFGEEVGRSTDTGGTSSEPGRDSGGRSSSGGSASTEPPPPRSALVRAYVESPTAFKLLVLEAAGGAPLGGCTVTVYSNGAFTPYRTFVLETNASRLGLCLGGALHPACQDVRSGNGYNGDDALTLACDGRVTDTIGVVGEDPGEAWRGQGADGAPLSTKDHSLWRCSDQATGAFSWSEWVFWPHEADPGLLGPTCPSETPGEGGAAPE